jgi:hypothetical protein
MQAMGSRTGNCRICGSYTQLSFEHVPPAAAFNTERILNTSFEKVLAAKNLDEVQGGKYQQRGAGAYTLCEPCNNNTGAWYADAYVSWAHQAMRYLFASEGNPSLSYPYALFPMRVFKQIVAMFFSSNGPGFQQKNPDLVRFVLNRESRELPPNFRVFSFYTLSNRSRSAGITGVLHGTSSHVFTEMAFPPFGFVMTVDGQSAPDPSLCEITGFAKFGYRDWRTGIQLHIPIKSIYSPFPGDYRTREQTLVDRAKNEMLEQQID